MPLARYFLYVGGVLLLLLIMADACLPKLPKTESADALRPVIRIHSDRKWPERVVYDTNRATIIPAQPAPEANISARSSVADASVRAQEAFAQLQPSDAAPPPWRSFEAVEFATLEWVDWFNNRRLLEPIGNIPPAEAEQRYYAMLEQSDMAA